jgi:hypothetical protein
VGLLVVAPVIATLKLIGSYTIRKMLDLDPWAELDARYQSDLAQKKGKGLPTRLWEYGGKIRTRLARIKKAN